MSIVTKNESSLHHSLKILFADSGLTEVEIAGFICDGLSAGGSVIEVQTGSFAPLVKKAALISSCLKSGQFFTIIHPIIAKKYIETYALNGVLLRRKTSPRKGSVYDLFKALMSAPGLLQMKKVRVVLAFVEVLEKRIDDGKGSWTRKFVSIVDKSLLSCGETIVLKGPKSLLQFLPYKKGESFTTKAFQAWAHITPGLAQRTIWTLRTMGLIKQTGKQGRSYVYALAEVF
jgi:hypothetical protein